MAGEKENEKMYDVSALGFGDNVVDKYEHIKTMYPGWKLCKLCSICQNVWRKKKCIYGIFRQ